LTRIVSLNAIPVAVVGHAVLVVVVITWIALEISIGVVVVARVHKITQILGIRDAVIVSIVGTGHDSVAVGIREVVYEHRGPRVTHIANI
jgi:hypothetical protein